MYHIDKIRSEINKYFNPNNAVPNSDEKIFSPNKKYSVETKRFKQEKPDCNWTVSKIEIYQNENSSPLFTLFVNEEYFFHAWVTKIDIEYLICAEDPSGGQTVIDLTNKQMSSYAADDDGFIWTKHLLSPNEKLLAVFGCIWGSSYFTVIYHFDNPMQLPLKIAYEPKWTGEDIIEWIGNKKIIVKESNGQKAILEL